MAAICDGKCACHEMSRNSITIKFFTSSVVERFMKHVISYFTKFRTCKSTLYVVGTNLIKILLLVKLFIILVRYIYLHMFEYNSMYPEAQ